MNSGLVVNEKPAPTKITVQRMSSVNYFSPLATIIFPHCLWSMRGWMESERREPVGRPEFTLHPASGSTCSFCFFPFAPENLHKPISVCQLKIDHLGGAWPITIVFTCLCIVYVMLLLCRGHGRYPLWICRKRKADRCNLLL